MVEDIKTLIDKLIKNLIIAATRQNDGSGSSREDNLVYNTLRDFLVVAWDTAGKSKDELIKILGQEIGVAIAAVLKEPLSQLTESKKLQITVELVPKKKNTKKPERGMIEYDG
ncbi:MAG: hypothetical protein HQK79_03500 [Desulfobacterales bacterium]|nr:hypothetical protein [Desulfobacterales bacterium]